MTLREVSHFYNHLSINLHAGVSLIPFFETLRATTSDTDQKKKISFILERLRKGNSLHIALKDSGFVPLFDLPIVDAAERSGRLVQILKVLSEKYDLSATTDKEISSGIYIPFFMLAIAVFLPDFPKLFIDQITLSAYMWKNMTIVAGLAAIVFMIRQLFMLSYYDLKYAQLKHNLFLKIPYFSNLVMDSARENFCTALEIMLESGIPVIEAIKLAGATSPDRDINLASRRIVGELKSGKTLSQAFQTENIFGADLQRAITTGWESGELPAMLRTHANMLRKEIARTISVLSKNIPMFMYWGAVVYVGYSILSVHLSNFKNLSNLLGGF